ncbi:hypothetical protein A2875_00835 [Candidatus Gottesmanbacteria bacterium RIFCSPHIGHO2_01_FULL_46_14]|uniref:Uncharacterized protein n=1 Tax=Candidatus Gottesmanbacteria bacterium RIFCSPHIGHO2_01_FULL_46_14 TaxID=1798380 RepID=A0A1F5ZKZ0_9BACT|nr:MAG: hypothetical protein A2875_00835 [Candidatus Gottesmanbacteria bacterium RIFCSPHIGHO2_01_FULL_46_14]
MVASSIYQEIGEKQEIQNTTNPSNLLFVRLGKVPHHLVGDMDFSSSHGAFSHFFFCFPNLRLTHQKARGSALEPWAALRAAPTSRNYVPLLNHVRTYFQRSV